MLVHFEHDEASGGHSLQELHAGEEARRETRKKSPIAVFRFPAEFPGDLSHDSEKGAELVRDGSASFLIFVSVCER